MDGEAHSRLCDRVVRWGAENIGPSRAGRSDATHHGGHAETRWSRRIRSASRAEIVQPFPREVILEIAETDRVSQAWPIPPKRSAGGFFRRADALLWGELEIRDELCGA